MKQLVTTGIVLSRTDFGEADRILTLLTPEHGKLRLVAKGVRHVKSKLAGGIELFSVSHITFIRGRGEIGTLISSRLDKHYANIVKDIERTMLGYELLKQLDRATEDEPEPAYFRLLQRAFAALDDTQIAAELIRLWFAAQLTRLGGRSPNLQTDTTGAKLIAASRYNFDFERMTFTPVAHGRFTAAHIKFLRLLFGDIVPGTLRRVTGATELLADLAPIIAHAKDMT